MASISTLAFRAARTPLAGALVRNVFGHVPRFVPLNRLHQSPVGGVYEHPRPCYGSRHLIVVPHHAVRDLFALAHPDNREVLRGLFEFVDEARHRFDAPHALVNGGRRQDVGQVHVHLSDDLGPLPPAHGEPLVYPGWTQAVLALAMVENVDQRWANGLSLIRVTDDSVRLH